MKKLISIILVIAMMMTAMTTGVFATDTDDPTTWKQYDERWGNLPLGSNGKGRMANWGCLVTSIAIQMARAGVVEEDFNPGILRNELETDGFITHASTVAADGNLRYGEAFSQKNSPEYFYAGSKDWTYTSFGEIRKTIAALQEDDYYVIVSVRFGDHFVAVEEVTQDDVKIIDPGYDIDSLRSYDGGIMKGLYFKTNTTTAESAKGDSVQVEDKDGVTLSGATKPSTLNVGDIFYCKGTITASKDNQLKHVVVGVYDENGSWMTGKCDMNINTCFYDIKTLADASVRFNILPRGEFTYKVIIITEDGVRTTLLEEEFTVK